MPNRFIEAMAKIVWYSEANIDMASTKSPVNYQVRRALFFYPLFPFSENVIPSSYGTRSVHHRPLQFFPRAFPHRPFVLR